MRKKTILWFIFDICLGCTLLLVSFLRIWQALDDLGIYDSTLLCAAEIFVAILGVIFGLAVLFCYAPQEIKILQNLKLGKRSKSMIHFPVESEITELNYSNGGIEVIFKNGTTAFISVDDVFNGLKDLQPTKETLRYRSERKAGHICVGKPTGNEGKTEPFYQKVEDEKVYLSKEEFSDYLTIKLNYEFAKSANEQLQIDNKRLYSNLAKYKEVVQIETAKEIFKWLKAHSDDAGFIIIKTYFAERFGVMEDEKDKD